MPVRFLNVQLDEDCQELKREIVAKIGEMRARLREDIEVLLGTIDRLITNRKIEETKAVFQAATRPLRNWFGGSGALAEAKAPPQAALLTEMAGLPYPPETVLKNGDMLIVMTDLSPMTLTLGRTVLLDEPFPVLHNQRIGKFQLKRPDDWSPAFFVTMMNDDRLRRKVIREATGTTVRHISPDRIRSGFAFRPKPEEQKEIVRRLEEMDSSIVAAVNESAKLCCLKSGLMADLLTGRVRVPLNTKETA